MLLANDLTNTAGNSVEATQCLGVVISLIGIAKLILNSITS